MPTTPTSLVAVDVETANPNGDICEFSAVAVDMASGARIFAVTSLVNPGPVAWSRMIMGVHGIFEDDVVGMPSIREVWARFLAEASRCGSPPIYAHHASSERGWLGRALAPTALPDIECSMVLAKRSIELPNYRLGTVCAHLGIPLVDAHRAEPDAAATAEVVRRLLGGAPAEAAQGERVRPRGSARPGPRATGGGRWTANEERGRNREIIAATARIGVAFAGKKVCITGQFVCGWTRKDAKQRVVAHGGVPLDDVTSGCSLLVMAGRAGPLAASDFRTQKARSALALGIEVIGEDEFRRRVGD